MTKWTMGPAVCLGGVQRPRVQRPSGKFARGFVTR